MPKKFGKVFTLWIALWITPVVSVPAQDIQLEKYFGSVERKEGEAYIGRFELSGSDIRKVVEAYRITYTSRDAGFQKPLTLAYLRLGNLSDDANPLGAAQIEFIYDASGRRTEKILRDKSGAVRSIVAYKYSGRFLAEELTLDAKRKLQFSIAYKSDAAGNVLEQVFKDAAGKVKSGPFGVAKRRMKYDAKGRITEQQAFDAMGKLVAATRTIYNVAGLIFEEQEFDAQNKLTEKVFYKYDAAGHRTLEQRYNAIDTLQEFTAFKYDARGNLLEESRYDGKGFLKGDMFGVAITRKKYDDANRLAEQSRTSKTNVLLSLEKYDGFGRAVETVNYNNEGVLILLQRRKFDVLGNPVEESDFILDAGAKLPRLKEQRLYAAGKVSERNAYHQSGYRTLQVKYDGNGKVIKQFFFDENGKIFRERS
ncbi:MAG: RHS repeat protein [Rhizobacter sp.]|nr:RHS repeat protein [Chlorobiales bacterium]